VILAGLRGNTEVGAEKRRADLGNKLLHCITGIAEPLAAEIPIKAGRVPRPVGQFVGEGGVFEGCGCQRIA